MRLVRCRRMRDAASEHLVVNLAQIGGHGTVAETPPPICSRSLSFFSGLFVVEHLMQCLYHLVQFVGAHVQARVAAGFAEYAAFWWLSWGALS